MSTITVIRHSTCSPVMDKADDQSDKDERKREYNRLAQREFRRRRKDHLKKLESAQKEQNSEQAEEIERLRYENDELRRENETLKGQLYGTSSSPGLLTAPISLSLEDRSYSISSSASSLSGTGSPLQSMPSDMLPLSALSINSNIPTSVPTFDTSYSMVHPSGLRQGSIGSLSPDSGFRTSSRSSQPSFHSMNIGSSTESIGMRDMPQSRFTAPLSNVGGSSNSLTTYDRAQAQQELHALFHPFYSDITVTSSPERHLAALFTISPSLPFQLQPSKAHLDTPHYYGIDMIASPTLRDRLLTVAPDVAESFIREVAFLAGEDSGQLIIWGQDPLNEMSWEFSQPILDRWGWLMGRDWVGRSNWWRRQRGVALLPEW